MTKKELIRLSRHEVIQLKKHATREELNRLDKDIFSPTKSDTCIYGLMTGDCYNDRSLELQKKSIKEDIGFNSVIGYIKYKRMKECLNSYGIGIESYNNSINKPINEDAIISRYFTPLEFYISYSNNHNIIKYLKGEEKRLVLK